MNNLLTIKTSNKKYNIYIGANILSELPIFLQQFNKQSKILIITDNNVAKFHLQQFKNIFLNTPYIILIYIVTPGEVSKNFSSYQKCLDVCFEANLNRRDLIIAFGGGVIGDLAGFTAATYMRGIPFIQLPTTLLAHDSAIGGKVGINCSYGKNLIGTFYQPEAVFYNLNYLNTLAEIEWKSGFAEIIKEALIADLTFFHKLQTEVKTILDIKTNIQNYIFQGMKIKTDIVRLDEKETKEIRVYLNFGHTLGHALERTINITHGEAVIFGIAFALKLSKKYCQLNYNLSSIIMWLKSLGYLQLSQRQKEEVTSEKLINYMNFDKKNSNNMYGFVLLKAIGEPIYKQLPREVVVTNLTKYINELIY